jgi:protein-tyrosine phosphatase
MKASDSIRLTGAPNFRDFGGYETSAGAKLRMRRLFRSDALDRLTHGDVASLRGLGIRLAFDLRSERERLARPSRWPVEPHAPEILLLDTTADVRAGDEPLLSMVKHDPTAAGARRLMLAAYRALPVRMAMHLRTVFDRLLAESTYPILIHCTAGKDRTGFLCGLVLFALGVPRAQVLHDYSLTDSFCDLAAATATMQRTIEFLGGQQIDNDMARILATTAPEYLSAAFEEVESVCGSVERYLEVEAGLDAHRRARLQALLLE